MNEVAVNSKQKIIIGLMTALGVVYGDIGTSCLYAFKAALASAGPITELNVFGILSMVFWSLILIVSIKYVIFILKADNHGEGGILALFSLLDPWGKETGKKKPIVMILGIFGCALLLGDGIITPAISVLSAVEGIKSVAPSLEPLVLPISIAILVSLFILQRHGTHFIGNIFGIAMLIWFSTIAIMGLVEIFTHPSVLQALNPVWAFDFARQNFAITFAVLGSVFLVLTGGEALYADLGHCGRKPITQAWFFFVLPSIVLNYFGQGALILEHPTLKEDPFFSMAPDLLKIPLVAIATIATVIASQALISGMFSLTRQAVSLGLSPRFRIEQTWEGEFGQIYVPAVNWLLMMGCCLLVLTFKSSDAMASAYGIAVTMTMLITTVLACMVMRNLWGWNIFKVAIFGSVFITIESIFTVSNMMKIFDGGWVPLAIGVLAFVSMRIWNRGSVIVRQNLSARSLSYESLDSLMQEAQVRRTPGTEVFLTKTDSGLPPILCEYITKTRSMADMVVIVHFETVRLPYLRRRRNISIECIQDDIWRVHARYGYMQTPRVAAMLAEAKILGVPIHDDKFLIVVGRETITHKPNSGFIHGISTSFFSWMHRNAARADHSFNVHGDKILEIGMQVEI